MPCQPLADDGHQQLQNYCQPERRRHQRTLRILNNLITLTIESKCRPAKADVARRSRTEPFTDQTMARINTSNPLVHRATQQKKTSQPPSSNTEEPYTRTKTSNNSTARSKTSSKVSTQKQKGGPGAMFDIFPDPAIESGSSASNTPQRQKRTRTLRATKANSLLLPLQQRPRQRQSAKVETDDYDKENDVAEQLAEPHSTEINTTLQRSPTRRARGAATPRRSRIEERQPSPVDPDTDEDAVEGDSVDSLDDFIVSDDEEISYHETSDSETEEERSPTPPPKSTRKRLMRGKKPDSRAEDITSNKTPPTTLSRPYDTFLDSAVSPITPTAEHDHLAQEDLNLTSKLGELNLEEGHGPESKQPTP